MEEMASVCLGSTANIMFNTFGFLGALVEFRTGLVFRLVKQMVDAQRKGEPVFFSWAITEPSAGTDVEDGRAMETMRPSSRADRVKGGYILNGTKCFNTNGSLAHYVIATIPADPSHPKESMATFLVPTNTDGFSVGRIERKCGQKASQTAELFFKDVFVPDEDLWALPGEGLAHTREILSITRGLVGLAGLALARGAFERCVQFANWKKIRSYRLIDEDWVQFALADMLKDIMAVRCVCVDFAISLDTYHVYKLFERVPVKAFLKIMPQKVLLGDSLISLAQNKLFSKAGTIYKKKHITEDLVETFVKNGSAVKVAGTDLAMDVSSRVLDVVGLEGMSYKFGIEKYFRDAKVFQIAEGTNQANRIDLFHNGIGQII
jgi:alkylation response protein AidB-like acyl-CoA dehydrogenase